MRFTSMFRYGLRALAVLADNYDKGPVSARQISEQEGISPSFLEQLLARLRQNGIVSGVRGPGGGFTLNRPPSRVRISDIVEALEGPDLVARCISTCDEPSGGACDKVEDCAVVPILRRMERDLHTLLDSYSLADVSGGRGTAAGRSTKRKGRHR